MFVNGGGMPPAANDIHNQQFELDLVCGCHLEFRRLYLNSPGIVPRLDRKGRHPFSGFASPRRGFPVDRITINKT
jgi:hypothetical protein